MSPTLNLLRKKQQKSSLDFGDSVDIRTQLRNNGNHTDRCKTAWKPNNVSRSTLFEN